MIRLTGGGGKLSFEFRHFDVRLSCRLGDAESGTACHSQRGGGGEIDLVSDADEQRAGVGAGAQDEADLLAMIDHQPTHAAVSAERAFLAALGGDCHSAVAALAQDGIVKAEILSADGSEIQAGEGEPAELARRLLAQASPALRAMFAP